jgi:hypothetical protein
VWQTRCEQLSLTRKSCATGWLTGGTNSKGTESEWTA